MSTQFLRLGVLAMLAGSAFAAIIPISKPGDATSAGIYTSATTLIPITTSFSSLTDGTETLTFSAAQTFATAPGGGWATWSDDSAGESERPVAGSIPVGYGPIGLTIDFSLPVSIFGFELEGDSFAINDFTVEFFSGATSLGSITRSVNGSGGSRLFAGESDSGTFDRVVVTGTDANFAAGQYRYGFTAIPEPSTYVLLGSGLALCALAGFRRRKA